MPYRARCNPSIFVQRRNASLTLRTAFKRQAAPAFGTTSGSASRSFVFVQDLSHNARRYNSTSSLFSPLSSFFSRVRGSSPSSSTPSTEAATESFLSCLDSHPLDLASLRSAYDIIISSTETTPAECLSANQLLKAMKVLVHWSTNLQLDQLQTLDFLIKIYEDIPGRFGYELEEQHKNLLVRGLANGGRPREALELASTLSLDLVDWRALLRSATAHDNSLIGEIVPLLRKTSALTLDDCVPVLRAIRYAYSSRRATAETTRQQLEQLLTAIEEDGIALNITTKAELARLHISLGNLGRAQALLAPSDKSGSDSSSGGISASSTPELWKAMTDLDIARSDAAGLEGTVQKMKNAGYEPPQKAISYLAAANLSKSIASRSKVGFSDIISAVESAERTSGVTAESVVWAEVVRLFLAEVKEHDSLDVGMQVYYETLSRGLEVGNDLARNLIIPLCNSRKHQRLNDAIRVYDDFTSSPYWSEGHITRREKDNFAAVYQYLLVACARSVPPAVGTAIRLLSDMRNHHIEITSSNMVSLLILLMKCSGDHSSAFNIYAHFYALDPSALDEQGYRAILTSFLNLSWENSPFPPPDMFVEMMKDMHKAGYQPGSHILSSLLKQYGLTATRLRRKLRSGTGSSASSAYEQDSTSASRAIATKSDDSYSIASREEQLDTLGQSIRDIHTLIKLDPLVSPDVPLLSSLMDAYGRVGAYSECFEVWDELVQRRSREPKSTLRQSYAAGINVILDACGWSYSLKRGRKAWNWCCKWDLIWEKKQYEGWIECLCRNGQIQEAAEFLLDEMEPKPKRASTSTSRSTYEPDSQSPSESQSEPEVAQNPATKTASSDSVATIADVEAARIIVKFGRREVDLGRNQEAVSNFIRRLEAEKNEWYTQLKQEGEIRG